MGYSEKHYITQLPLQLHVTRWPNSGQLDVTEETYLPLAGIWVELAISDLGQEFLPLRTLAKTYM